jgi:hypothetical protein
VPAVGSPSSAVGSVSSEEVTSVLLHGGGRLVAHQMHGDFLEVRRRLLFLRRTSAMTDAEIADVLRTAAMGADELRAMVDELGTGVHHAPEMPAPRR